MTSLLAEGCDGGPTLAASRLSAISCRDCGTVFVEGAAFCHGCGAQRYVDGVGCVAQAHSVDLAAGSAGSDIAADLPGRTPGGVSHAMSFIEPPSCASAPSRSSAPSPLSASSSSSPSSSETEERGGKDSHANDTNLAESKDSTSCTAVDGSSSPTFRMSSSGADLYPGITPKPVGCIERSPAKRVCKRRIVLTEQQRAQVRMKLARHATENPVSNESADKTHAIQGRVKAADREHSCFDAVEGERQAKTPTPVTDVHKERTRLILKAKMVHGERKIAALRRRVPTSMRPWLGGSSTSEHGWNKFQAATPDAIESFQGNSGFLACTDEGAGGPGGRSRPTEASSPATPVAPLVSGSPRENTCTREQSVGDTNTFRKGLANASAACLGPVEAESPPLAARRAVLGTSLVKLKQQLADLKRAAIPFSDTGVLSDQSASKVFDCAGDSLARHGSGQVGMEGNTSCPDCPAEVCIGVTSFGRDIASSAAHNACFTNVATTSHGAMNGNSEASASPCSDAKVAAEMARSLLDEVSASLGLGLASAEVYGGVGCDEGAQEVSSSDSDDAVLLVCDEDKLQTTQRAWKRRMREEAESARKAEEQEAKKVMRVERSTLRLARRAAKAAEKAAKAARKAEQAKAVVCRLTRMPVSSAPPVRI